MISFFSSISLSLPDWLMLGGLLAVFLYQLYFYVRYMAGVQRRVRHQSKGRFRWNEQKQQRRAAKAAAKAAKAAEKEACKQEEARLAATPDNPDNPATPESPESPEIPESPEPPEIPESPEPPEIPETPAPQPSYQPGFQPGYKPGVSVVVVARNEGVNLQSYLHALVCQRYPQFEVIVVNDASQDNTQLVLEHYQKNFRNLHLTFVPTDAMVLSSKKLALTLAAKASHYDYLLLTDADCRPESPYWIEEMMKGFCRPETEIVLGYSGCYEEPSRVNRVQQFDTVFGSMRYLGMAMSRHPFKGVGRNLAYRKDTFFSNRGFAGQLGQREGDDDLFVNKICNARNTEVVLTPASYTWAVPEQSFEQWRIRKGRQLAVLTAYKLSTRLRLAFEPLTRALWYVLLTAAVVLAVLRLLSPITAFAAAALFLIRLIWQMAIINRAGRIFGMSGFGIEVLRYDIFLPVEKLFLLLRQRRRNRRHIQWG